MCCWCCERKDEDERELDAEERGRKQERKAEVRATKKNPAAAKQPQPVISKLVHAPGLQS